MTTLDYLIVVLYLFSIFYIGIRYRDRSSNFSTFMIAGRKVGLSLGVATMLGTELGLITVMYNAQTGFKDFFAANITFSARQSLLKVFLLALF